MRECKVCENSFELAKLKNEVYIVAEPRGYIDFSPLRQYDAVDCLYCGCQNILNERFIKLDENTDADDCTDEAVTETITTDERDGGKTQLEDCAACWCNTCAIIEECNFTPIGVNKELSKRGLRPYPCTGCDDGKRFAPVERPRCTHYVEGEENNG